MGSRRQFKKDLNEALSEIIEECYLVQLDADDKTASKAEKVIDEAIEVFDDIIHKIYADGVEDYRKHYRVLREELDKSSAALTKKIKTLKG